VPQVILVLVGPPASRARLVSVPPVSKGLPASKALLDLPAVQLEPPESRVLRDPRELRVPLVLELPESREPPVLRAARERQGQWVLLALKEPQASGFRVRPVLDLKAQLAFRVRPEVASKVPLVLMASKVPPVLLAGLPVKLEPRVRLVLRERLVLRA